ncbi:MAG: hypothetical protein LAO19_10365 [Acidobacteriia bacterium]|nr:hypothetical protein [Terriglobia bacterium]
MKKFALFPATMFCLVLMSTPLWAHHGEANYDTEKTVSVKGTVTQFEFVNPHVQITMAVKNEKGETETWTSEARSPAMLSRYGDWNRNTIKVGDVITCYGHRTKNGTFFLRLQKIVKADGKELPNL